MRTRRVFSFTFIAFTLIPTFLLVLAAETTVRLKYFFAHGHEWGYLTTPFRRVVAPNPQPTEHPRTPRVAPQAAPAVSQDEPKDRGGVARIAPSPAPVSQDERKNRGVVARVARQPASAVSQDQMVFKWQTPCMNTVVYSAELRKVMPRTYDEHCFRGDRVPRQKEPGEYRIVFVGGSTVEDRQSDAEMMTTQFKSALRPTVQGRTSVINAGRAGLDSLGVLQLYDSLISPFAPDLVLYYEAWNEQQIADTTFRRAEQALVKLRSWRLHRVLNYRSMLYTYLVEKYEFAAAGHLESTVWRKARFWKIEVANLRAHFTSLTHHVRRDGARFVFVTQVVNWPRMWKGIDTFDYRAADGLLDRLKADNQYTYDVKEISALNQRLAVAYTITLCRELNVPIINILEPVEALGEVGREELFLDLGHRTVKGDKIVGKLIAKRLNLSE
jgi:hypothetical protein